MTVLWFMIVLGLGVVIGVLIGMYLAAWAITEIEKKKAKD